MWRTLLVSGLVGCAGEGSRSEPLVPLLQSGVPAGTPTTGTGGLDATVLHTTPEVACADPSARDERAFDRFEDPAWTGQPFFDVSDFAIEEGSGLGVADFNGDGWLDVFVADWAQPRLFTGRPGRVFVDETDTWMPPSLGQSTGAAPVDLDDDGDLDLFLARTTWRSQFLINVGSKFRVGAPLAVDTANLHTVNSSWGDVDGDGDLDGYVNTYGIPHGAWDMNFVLRNEGDGTYVDGSAAFPEDLLSGHTLAGGWYDLDGDFDLDVYLVNDFGQTAMTNQVGWNDGAGGFTEDAEILGLDVAMAGMGSSAEDLDGDGRLDLLLSGWKRAHLLQSGTDALWVDGTTASHLPLLWSEDPDRRLPWGNALDDLDNDGDYDAAVAFGFLRDTFGNATNPFEQRDAVLENVGGEFLEVTDAWGVDSRGVSRGLLTPDLDGDGWLDLIIQDLAGPPEIFFARCGASSWLRVRLAQPGVNRFGIGAVVTVVAGDRTWTRTLRAGGASIASGGPPELHFGLGDAVVVDRLEIRWPDGEVDTFTDVEPRTFATVTRGEGATAPEETLP